jgi:hypothetical protein
MIQPLRESYLHPFSSGPPDPIRRPSDPELRSDRVHIGPGYLPRDLLLCCSESTCNCILVMDSVDEWV